MGIDQHRLSQPEPDRSPQSQRGFIAGREICIERTTPLDPGPTDSDTIDVIPRGYTRTVGFTEGKTTKLRSADDPRSCQRGLKLFSGSGQWWRCGDGQASRPLGWSGDR
jgi:hypothetical protein